MKKKIAKTVFRVLSERKAAAAFCKAVYLLAFLVLMYAGVCFRNGQLTEGEDAYTYFLALSAFLPSLWVLFGLDRTEKKVYNNNKK